MRTHCRYNGHSPRQLYNQAANLLDALHTYSRWGGTGVGLFIHAWHSAPACDDPAQPQARPGMVRRSREAFAALHSAAGLVLEVHHDEAGGQQQLVLHKGEGGPARQWAYLWHWERQHSLAGWQAGSSGARAWLGRSDG
jgi:hypothetical protein